MNPNPASKPTPVVEHGKLTLGHRLGQGGQGTVHQVTNKTINKSMGGGGWAVAYKEYAPALLPELDAAALAAQVDLPHTLSAAESRWLCDKTAWPAAVVRRNGQTCGLLMRLVPERFQFTLKSLNGTTGDTRKLANLEFLLNEDSYVAGIGLNVSERDRVLLLADLAATLARLHRIGITIGDLSPKNLLFTTDQGPECFLIDCDAMRLRGATALPQAETPDWQIPVGEEKATRSSDAYKFALLAVRLFARDQTATDSAVLRALSPKLADLADAGLSREAARRPTPAAWAEQLTVAAPKASAASAAPSAAPWRLRPRPPARPRVPSPGAGSPTAVPSGVAAVVRALPRKVIADKVRSLVVALVVVLVGVLGVVTTGDDDSSAAGSYHTPQPETSVTDLWTYQPPELPDSDYGATEDTTDEEETETPSATLDPFGEAELGSCFYDEGSGSTPDLVATDCTTGAFKVVDINRYTTDLDSCDGVTDSDESVSSSAHDLVLCLSYLSSAGDVYHADQGDCVYGEPDSGRWSTQPCETGNFKVLAVYHGHDEAKCDGWPHYNQWKRASGPGGSDTDVLLCLSMNYPDDGIGYAEQYQCFLKQGSGDDTTFTNTGSCSTSNVVVTGRTSRYDVGDAFCNGDGWSTWRSTDYPEHAYTVCFRWR